MRILCSPFANLLGGTPSSASSNITDSENRPWTHIGEAKDHLFDELEQLYWTGVEQALESVVITLKAWESDKLNEVALPDESDNFVHGFDTFIDQVSEESQQFANQIRVKKDRGRVRGESMPKKDYVLALEQSALGATMEYESSKLKADIRQAVEDQEPELPLRRRTRMLLQAVGLLDIEKLVEHRPPLDNLSFWKRPAVPQLQLREYSKSGFPTLTSLQCSSCGSIIRSSMYCRTEENEVGKQTPVDRICEDCYREKDIGEPAYMKMYKHCILDEIITPHISRKICLCDDVPHRDPHGKSLDLFPVSKDSKHLKSKIPGTVECGLFKLGEAVAEAKYSGMRTIGTKKKIGQKNRNLAEEKRYDDKQRADETKLNQKQRPKIMTQQSQHAPERDATSGTAVGIEEAEADEDIPFFLKRYTEKYPFGNVHMALRIGPVVIENGVAQ